MTIKFNVLNRRVVAAYIASDQQAYIRHIMIAKRLWALPTPESRP